MPRTLMCVCERIRGRVYVEGRGRLRRPTPEHLSPKLWYGMPAGYKHGKVVCSFQDAQKFKSRYATFGFSDAANLDEESGELSESAQLRLKGG